MLGFGYINYFVHDLLCNVLKIESLLFKINAPESFNEESYFPRQKIMLDSAKNIFSENNDFKEILSAPDISL